MLLILTKVKNRFGELNQITYFSSEFKTKAATNIAIKKVKKKTKKIATLSFDYRKRIYKHH